MTSKLPSFDAPPLKEMAMGLQFDPVVGMSFPGMLEFLHRFSPALEVAEVTPPVGKREEYFDGEPWTLQIPILQGNLPRIRARSPDLTRLLQLENGWLVYNWISRHGVDYPRWASLHADYTSYVTALFDAFGGREPIQPNLWEVSYLNRLPKGDQWESPEDLLALFEGLFTPTRPIDEIGLSHEGCKAEWSYSIEGHRARLRIYSDIKMGPEGKVVFVLQLVARGRVDGNDASQWLKQLNTGHETIVRTFEKVSSETARQHWGPQ